MKDGAELTAQLDRVKAASSRLQHVSGWESEARREFETAIREAAYKSGASTRQIARAAGVSHARIFQIVKERPASDFLEDDPRATAL
jgi:transcriptional regulator of aromatic amino acid metabolism